MELSHDFRVGVPIARAWALLTDIERIAPSLPGAQLEGVEGDEYRGSVKVKVGPVTTQYKGKAYFLERDASQHRAVLRAEGRETRGQGDAKATITANLTSVQEGTHVEVVTDLAITGKVAQMGRGLIHDVSAKLMDQFVGNLERDVLAGEVGDDADSAESETPAGQAAEVEPVDLLAAAAGPVFKRAVPLAIGGILLLAIIWQMIRA